MTQNINRRDFVVVGAAAGLSLAIPATGMTEAPAVITRSAAKPLVIASGNGNRFRNGGSQTAVEKAFSMITGGSDVLDAVVAGVNIVELDPLDDSVGYGGLPNADGVVQLDSCVMHGPKKRAGGVAGIEGIRTPANVAKEVMLQTDHHLLAGKGAQDFARKLGFTVEDDLNTPNSRAKWLEWKRRTDPLHYLDPNARAAAEMRVRHEMVAEGLLDAEHIYGTINCDAINAKGEICGVTTTSGLAWKVPGRVGDSPILGAGLYVDNDVGAAGSTGRGEANLYNLSSYVIVDNMRKGMHPRDAMIDVCKRIAKNTVEKRLLNSRGLPNFGMSFYALDKQGRYAGVGMYKAGSYAICTENGAQTFEMEPAFEGKATD
ncbi:MAG: N(4)-(beta-N-acetylglucosaminyl)-L-asparaginase [Gemmatimonadaceae bacterium]|nr:N(4)-(beta-N-acetylglucosaminyl)-L-asparaginase [Gemmatimonadaceae bacterium]